MLPVPVALCASKIHCGRINGMELLDESGTGSITEPLLAARNLECFNPIRGRTAICLSGLHDQHLVSAPKGYIPLTLHLPPFTSCLRATKHHRVSRHCWLVLKVLRFNVHVGCPQPFCRMPHLLRCPTAIQYQPVATAGWLDAMHPLPVFPGIPFVQFRCPSCCYRRKLCMAVH